MDDNQYKPYSEREEWRDVSPIRQNAQNNDKTICKINYSEKFVDVYDYVRAVMLTDELSARALQLTEDALNLNPANYSVWFYRRNILKRLKIDLSTSELKFVAELINDNPKNYQVWYHRQWIIDELSILGDKEAIKSILQDEFLFIDALLCEENKNYHVWQYRNWLVNHFGVWESELLFTGKMLEADCFNSSAWNHRYYAVKAVCGGQFSDNIIQQETDYVCKFIKKAPENEGAWNYLRGLYKDKDISLYGNLLEFCNELNETNSNSSKSPYLHSFLLDIYLSKLRNITKNQIGDSKTKEEEVVLQSSIDTCNLLGQKLDRIRVNYWMYRLSQIVNEFSSDLNDSK